MVCAPSVACQEYGAAFAPTVTRNVLNESARQSARAGVVMAMPLAIEAPENIDFDFSLNAAVGGQEREYGDESVLLHEDANVFAHGCPITVPANGGAPGAAFVSTYRVASRSASELRARRARRLS